MVKRCVEYCDHGCSVSEDPPRRMDAAHRRRIVQRREIIQGLDARERLVVDHRRRGKKIAAVDHPVRYGIDPARTGASRHCQIETANDFTHADLVIGRGDFLLLWSERAASLELEYGLVTEPIEDADDQLSILRYDSQLACSFDQLKLYGGAAAVEYQNVHGRRWFFPRAVLEAPV